MRVKEEYRVCDRCKQKIKERWYRLADFTRFKKRLVTGGFVHDRYFDLCGSCTERFDRFMDMRSDIDDSTEYERYYNVSDTNV